MIRSLSRAACGALMALVSMLAAVTAPTVAAAGAVPPARLALLARGMNGDNILDNTRFAPYTDADLAGLKAMGITYIRADIDCSYVVPGLPADGQTALSDTARVAMGLAHLDSVLARLHAAGFALVITPHIHVNLWALGTPAAEAAVLAANQVLAARYVPIYGPELFLEPVNEAHMDPAEWNRFAPILVGAVRKIAIHNTLIIDFAGYAEAKNAAALTPIQDGNIVYAMHVYAPPELTGEGAGVTIDLGYLFPRPAVGLNPKMMTEAKLAAYFQVGPDWARLNGVPLIMDEFGATNVSDRASRNAWVKFVRSLADGAKIGWAWWAFDGRLFGVNPHDKGWDTDLVALLTSPVT